MYVCQTTHCARHWVDLMDKRNMVPVFVELINGKSFDKSPVLYPCSLHNWGSQNHLPVGEVGNRCY